MRITEVRNAVSLQEDNRRLDVEINHPQYGWIPYTVDPADTDATIDNDQILALIGSSFTPYAPPSQEELERDRATTRLPRHKFAIAAAKAGLITEAEAEEWAAGASIPAWVSDTIEAAVTAGAIPTKERLPVRVAVRTQDTIGRTDRLIPILADSAGLTPEQVDALFGIDV